MKNYFILILSIFATGLIIGCTKGGELEGANGSIYNVTSSASSKQLIPAIDTTSTGIFTGLYDDQTNILTYTVAWTDLWRDTKKDTLTSINFYGPATVTTTGNLIRSVPLINTNKTSQINLGLAGLQALLPTEKNDFLAGAYYFTLNTKQYPKGIIRGQLSVVK